jgi:hypothetical protein
MEKEKTREFERGSNSSKLKSATFEGSAVRVGLH